MALNKKYTGKTSGQPGEGYSEKKVADRPKFIRKNERGPIVEEDTKGFPRGNANRNLWADPAHENEARAQVRGAAEVGAKGQGLRAGEDDHPGEPEMTHYGHDAGEIESHQEAIIDKHNLDGAAPFSHRARGKEAYELAPESRTITKGFRGANGPSGNPQARRN